jgi:hypothetical protein
VSVTARLRRTAADRAAVSQRFNLKFPTVDALSVGPSFRKLKTPTHNQFNQLYLQHATACTLKLIRSISLAS